MTALGTAIALAVASAAAYAAASVLQERAAGPPDPGARSASPGTVPAVDPPGALDFLTRDGWWHSVWLNGAGAALHVAALGFGSLSVVQPLGVLTLVLALPLGAATGGRRASRRQWRGAATTVAGLTVFLLLTTPGAAAGKGLTVAQGAMVSAGAGASVLGLAVAARLVERLLARCLLAAAAAGFAFATASALTQTVTQQARHDGTSALLSPLALVVAAMAASGLLLSQFAYRNAGLGAPLATLTLANPIASTAIGVLIIGDRTAGGFWGALAAVLGAAVAMAGVVLLAEPRSPRDRGEATGGRGRDPSAGRSERTRARPGRCRSGAAGRSWCPGQRSSPATGRSSPAADRARRAP